MSTIQPTLKEVLNAANPTTLADALKALGLGDVLRALPVHLTKQVPATSPTNMIANTHAIVLPDDAKCGAILSCYVRAGTVNGAFTCDNLPQSTSVTTAHVAKTESGDIAFLDSDAVTSVDIVYVPRKMDVVILTNQPVVSGTGVCALPSWVTTAGVVTILSAVSTGTTGGTCKVVAPAAAVPTTTLQCNLNLAKTQAQFRIADVITSATIKLGLIPAIDVNALLAAASTIL
jgi:hypothetical protein